MVQLLRSLAAPEGPSSVPNPHVKQLTTTIILAPGILIPLVHTGACIHMHTLTPTNNN